jgi:hypothetical protein
MLLRLLFYPVMPIKISFGSLITSLGYTPVLIESLRCNLVDSAPNLFSTAVV